MENYRFLLTYKDTSLYLRKDMDAKNTTNGRPKVKGPLRNFRLREEIDGFLTDEAARTGKDMTLLIEQALAYFQKLKPGPRDALMGKAFSQ